MSDPVAALNAALTTRDTYEGIIAALAEQGYVLVNAEGLAAALPVALRCGGCDKDERHAAAILAAIQDSRLQEPVSQEQTDE